jgi:ribonuclease-3
MRQFFRRLKSKLSRGPKAQAKDPDALQRAIEYQFKTPLLLHDALIHRSYLPTKENSNSEQESNERMEFLGDSVLSLVVNDFLYSRYPEKSEGELTKMKSVIVSKQVLSDHAKKHNIGSYIFLSDNAQKAGVSEVDSVLADTLEAIFGAVFLDGGFEAARQCIRAFFLKDLGEIVYNEDNVNYKSLLQEYIQALHKIPPRYRVNSTQGPDHDKEFGVEVSVRGTILGSGRGKTKKLAEQEAAREAYRKLLNPEDFGHILDA